MINRLNLQEVWARKGGPPLSEAAAHKILRSSLTVSQSRDTNLISIQARRQDPREAMLIANEVANVYHDSRRGIQQKKMTQTLDALRRELEKQQAKVVAAEKNLETLRTEPSRLQQQKQELDVERSIMKALSTRLVQEKITLQILRSPVEIIDSAGESIRPVSPNLMLNVLTSLILASVFPLMGLPLLIIGLKRT